MSKVCICFFGLTRSLNYTYDSIKKNLLDILEQNNIEYDIYLHTYNLKVLTNPRSDEYNEKLDTNEFKLLNPKEFIIDNQNEFDKKFDYDIIKKYGDTWYDDYKSLYNLIRQLNSLKQVTSLIINKCMYDKYIYIRPDLLVKTELNIKYIKYISTHNYLFTPNWGKWIAPAICRSTNSSDVGTNDRFAIGNYNSIVKYGNRIDDIYDYMKMYGCLHSESLVKYIIQKYNINNIEIPIILIRVRANGKYNSSDLKLLDAEKAAETPSTYPAAENTAQEAVKNAAKAKADNEKENAKKPAATAKKPAATAKKPAATAKKPAASAKKPAASAKKPAPKKAGTEGS